LVFIMGITMRADWLVFWAYYQKSQEKLAANISILNEELAQEFSGAITSSSSNNLTQDGVNDSIVHHDLPWNDNVRLFFELRFANFMDVCIPAFFVSYIFFFAIGGYLHITYYVNLRDQAKEWKCQPYHWLPRDLEIHEMVVGAFSLALGSLLSSAIACWILNDGYSKVYFDVAEHGYVWFVLQIPIVFIGQDYIIYWSHRIFHLPFLYKNFHKLHHTYKQPTAFSVTAIHPVEFVFNQCIYIAPMFLLPVHWVPFSFILMYTYYHGIIDHSGITFKRQWWQPWQPDCIFHDNHHQYFHVNFGFNIEYWDKLHGTYRRKDRIYHEDTFYGQGKSISEATEEELKQDITERVSENPLAYSGNKLHYELTEDEIMAKKAL